MISCPCLIYQNYRKTIDLCPQSERFQNYMVRKTCDLEFDFHPAFNAKSLFVTPEKKNAWRSGHF